MSLVLESEKTLKAKSDELEKELQGKEKELQEKEKELESRIIAPSTELIQASELVELEKEKKGLSGKLKN